MKALLVTPPIKGLEYVEGVVRWSCEMNHVSKDTSQRTCFINKIKAPKQREVHTHSAKGRKGRTSKKTSKK